MTELPSTLFEASLPGIGRPLTQSEGSQYRKYLKLLIKWQKTHRLVGSIDLPWIVENVLIHSLCFLEALPADVRSVVDIGSGAGLPGVPIALVRPDLHLTLVEAKRRRVSFLSTVVRELGLEIVKVVDERVENLGPSYAARFDAAVMRCAGEEPLVLAEALRLVRVGGVVVVSSHPEAPLPDRAEEINVRTHSGLRTFHRVTKR